MKILLTEDEIEALSVWWLDAPEAVDWAETLNRAQVKKVVEWVNEHCPHAGPPGDDPTQEKKYCNACWQALKKEAGL